MPVASWHRPITTRRQSTCPTNLSPLPLWRQLFLSIMLRLCYNSAMGLFNFFKKSERGSSSETPDSTATPWDSLGAEPFQGDSAAEAAQKNLKRQGDKIIAAYYHGINALEQPQATVSEEERAGFYDALTHDQFDDTAQSHMLQAIALPSGGPGRENYQKVFDQINDPQSLTIINYIGQLGGGKSQPLTADSLPGFLQACPTPVEFAPRATEMIRIMKADPNIPPLRTAEYEDKLAPIQQSIYGKRYEYYQALQELKEQAYGQARTRANAEAAAQRMSDMQSLQAPASAERAQQELQDNPYASQEMRDFYDPSARR